MDLIDQMNEQWRKVRPDLDPTPLEVVGRVIVLAQYLERSVNEALAPHGLTLGQFDILATLRRQPDGRLTPTQLLRSVVLSSGGMTTDWIVWRRRAGFAGRPIRRTGVAW